METAEAEPTLLKAATRYRDGLIVAFLAGNPIRLRNLAGLELHRTLVPRANGWWVQFPAEETKARKPIESPWPAALVPMLDTYLETYRPELMRRRGYWSKTVGDALWVSSDGSPLGHSRFYACIVQHTQAAFGERIGPHKFRHVAATSIAIEDPENVGIIPSLLGNSEAVAQRYYNRARALDGARRVQAVVAGLREGRLVFPDEEEPAPPQLPTDGSALVSAGHASPTADRPAEHPGETDAGQRGDLTGQVFGRLEVLHRIARTA